MISRTHTPPSPIWKITRIFPMQRGGSYALLSLVHPQGWGPGPIKSRQVKVATLEHANEMIVLALAIEDFTEASH